MARVGKNGGKATQATKTSRRPSEAKHSATPKNGISSNGTSGHDKKASTVLLTPLKSAGNKVTARTPASLASGLSNENNTENPSGSGNHHE